MSVLVNETLANASAAYQRGLADSAMARFYNAQAEAYPQNAEAQRTGQYATAYATRAGVPSEIAERQAQTGLLGQQATNMAALLRPDILTHYAQAGLIRGQAGEIPADIMQRLAQAKLLGANAAWYRTLSGLPPTGDSTTPVGPPNTSIQPNPIYNPNAGEIPGVTNIGGDVLTGQEEGGVIEPGYEKGASRAPGKAGKGMPAPGPTDSVPAMLAPGEAVLNRGAREHVESFAPGLIAHLNKVGLMRMAAQGGPDSPNNPEARAAQRGVPASKGSKASRDKTSKSSSNPQTSSRASDSQEKPPKKGGTGGGMPGYQAGSVETGSVDPRRTEPLSPAAAVPQRGQIAVNGSIEGAGDPDVTVSRPYRGGWVSAKQPLPGYQMGDAEVVRQAQDNNGGFVGLGGGIFDWLANQTRPRADNVPYNPADLVAQPRSAVTPSATPAVTRFTPVATPSAGFQPARTAGMPPFQSFEAGVEEVFPVTGVMTGLDARALAGRAKEGNQNVSKVARATVNGAGGMPKFAKGATRVKASSKGTKSLAQVPMPAPSQATLPAMPSLPMASVPQPSYPGGSFL